MFNSMQCNFHRFSLIRSIRNMNVKLNIHNNSAGVFTWKLIDLRPTGQLDANGRLQRNPQGNYLKVDRSASNWSVRRKTGILDKSAGDFT